MVDTKPADGVKEKLVALLEEEYKYKTYEDMADGMIAAGVTFAADNYVGGKWIRPEEQLPDVHKPVLVCREKEPGVLIVEQGCKDLGDWWRVYGTRVKRIRYWMPLPEAPKEEEK